MALHSYIYMDARQVRPKDVHKGTNNNNLMQKIKWQISKTFRRFYGFLFYFVEAWSAFCFLQFYFLLLFSQLLCLSSSPTCWAWASMFKKGVCFSWARLLSGSAQKVRSHPHPIPLVECFSNASIQIFFRSWVAKASQTIVINSSDNIELLHDSDFVFSNYNLWPNNAFNCIKKSLEFLAQLFIRLSPYVQRYLQKGPSSTKLNEDSKNQLARIQYCFARHQLIPLNASFTLMWQLCPHFQPCHVLTCQWAENHLVMSLGVQHNDLCAHCSSHRATHACACTQTASEKEQNIDPWVNPPPVETHRAKYKQGWKWMDKNSQILWNK